jgi:hypothetical protein
MDLPYLWVYLSFQQPSMASTSKVARFIGISDSDFQVGKLLGTP